MSNLARPRRFLFLQGPHGSFFARLGAALAAAGYGVERINLCGGDRIDWPGGGVNYHGTRRNWPLFFDDFVVERGITDVLLFGDCRPLHTAAHKMAKLRNLRVHVVEEGYIRPDFVTFEEGGVNGHSTLPSDPAWYLRTARGLPEFSAQPPVPSAFSRRVRETSRYGLASVALRPLFPFYRTHRINKSWLEAVGWANRLAHKAGERRRSARIWEQVRTRPYFMLPLQLNGDYQIRVHSPFGNMRAALRFIVKSFAKCAPDHASLLIKRHPLDPGLIPWSRAVRKLAAEFGVEDRIFYVGEEDISLIVGDALGVVTVNSTVGTLALNRGVPVAILGDAVYGIPGIVHIGSLDRFWRDPRKPDLALYDAFRKVLMDRCLIRGGFLSEEALDMLVANAMRRLTRYPGEAGIVEAAENWR